MSDETMTIGEPHDRLTRMCDAMIDVFERHPEYREGDQCIILLDDEGRGGLVLHGYDDTTDAIPALFSHMRAVFRVNGHDLMMAPLNRG